MSFKKTLSPFYYDKQLKNFILQFMAIFTDLYVKVGENDLSGNNDNLISVPISYATRDRVALHIKSNNTNNAPQRLPRMSAYLTGMEYSFEHAKGSNVMSHREVYASRGDVIPDDLKTMHHGVKIPYKLNADLYIFTSNMEQRMQILEQILLVFNPILQIQRSDSPFDTTKLANVELMSIDLDETETAETRVLETRLNFSFVVYLSPPKQLINDVISKIILRVKTVSTDFDLDSYYLDSDDQDKEGYQKIVDLDLMDLPKK